jgi:hypothetical protein
MDIKMLRAVIDDIEKNLEGEGYTVTVFTSGTFPYPNVALRRPADGMLIGDQALPNGKCLPIWIDLAHITAIRLED